MGCSARSRRPEAVAAVAEYVVDPALMLPDPFGALRELDVEVWRA